MGEVVLIYGKSGSGKSRSLKGFSHDEILYINTAVKRLPFKGKGFDYTINTDDTTKIIGFFQKMASKHPEIKTYVVDDYGYTMANYFMREHSKGRTGNAVYQMYNEIGDGVYKLVEAIKKLPEDIIVYLMMHEDISDDGSFKLRTIGKLCDEKIGLEGRVTICIRCIFDGDTHKFITNADNGIAKSPEDMFPQEMPNDLKAVDTAIREYYEIDTTSTKETTEKEN